MKRLITRLIFIVFAILFLSVVSNAEITGDLTNANAVMTGKTTFKLFNVTVSGDIPTNTYWAEFRWDPIKLAFVPIGYGINGAATYSSSGTYTYNPGTSTLTLNTTSSDFECDGPEIGTEQITVSSITSTTMIWQEQEGDMTWTRESGIGGNIVGTWESSDDETGNSWEATFGADGSFSVVGSIVQCGNGGDVNGGDITMITPYVSSSDIRSIWLFDYNSHRGIDFQPSGNLIPFRAVSSGVIENIELMQLESSSNWQVEVEIKYNSTYTAFYAFEPMTAVQADGEIQLANISVSVGQDVSQGNIIGYLYSAGEGAHVHFGLFKYIPNGGDPTTCPEPYFTPEARDSLLNLIHREYPDANICN